MRGESLNICVDRRRNSPDRPIRTSGNPVPTRHHGAMTSWTQLMDHVSERHGVVTRAELIGADLSETQVDRLTASGRLVIAGVGVFRVAGAPDSFEGRVLSAILGTESEVWASHRTAARLWGIRVPGPDRPMEVSRPYGLSARRGGLRVHRTTYLPEHHRTMVRQIPVTTAARTLFDLARSTSPHLLDRAVEEALRDRLCSVGALHRVLAELGGRGRPGTRRMRSILEHRDIDYIPTASELEAVGRAVLGAIPGIEWEVNMSDEQGYIRRVDAMVRSARVVIEFDGVTYHGQPTDVAHDNAGDARLIAAGYVVLRFGWIDLTSRPESVRATVDRLVKH